MEEYQSFRQRVYELTKLIPAGRVATYRQLAELAGSSGAARAVGVCMKENPDSSTIPCHRVVASNGHLIDYGFGGVKRKKEKLLAEGVVFVGDCVNLLISQWGRENNVIQDEFLYVP